MEFFLNPTQRINPVTGQPTNPGTGQQTQAPAPAPRDPFDASLDPFRARLTQQQGLIDQNIGQVGGLAGLLQQIGGQFGQFAQGEDPLIAMQREAAAARMQANLARQGVTGTVAQNELNNLDQGFTQQQLAQRNQALMNQAQLAQGAAGLFGLQTQFGGEGLQNTLAIPTLNVANTAAQNAGKGGGGGGGGGGRSCAIICLILTDELVRTGELSYHLFLSNVIYAGHSPRTDAETYRGYRLWASPLIPVMRRRPLVRRIVRWAVTRYCQQAAHAVGQDVQSTIAGRFLLWAMPAVSRFIARRFPGRVAEIPLCPIYQGR